MSNQPSICIPYIVDERVGKSFIKRVFDRYGWGEISRIDVVRKHKKCKAFIHFKKWNGNEKSQSVRKRLLAGEMINIIYDGEVGWFWKCSASKLPKPER